MNSRRRWIGFCAPLIAASILVLSRSGRAEEGAKGPALDTATFAMGCFWCAETAFEGLPGVASVTSGYTGGFKKDPTYEEVSSGTTGHYESIQVAFDPKAVTYAQLLDLFWHNIDPTQDHGQFCDHGDQYRAAVFYANDAQKKLALEARHKIETTRQRFKGTIMTQMIQASTFYPAEDYHQDFYKKDPVRYKSYRFGCGRDQRLEELWGEPGRQGHH